jgi:hypothetical protein
MKEEKIHVVRKEIERREEKEGRPTLSPQLHLFSPSSVSLNRKGEEKVWTGLSVALAGCLFSV